MKEMTTRDGESCGVLREGGLDSFYFKEYLLRRRVGVGVAGLEKQDNEMKFVGALRLGEAPSKYVRATLCLCLVCFLRT